MDAPRGVRYRKLSCVLTSAEMTSCEALRMAAADLVPKRPGAQRRRVCAGRDGPRRPAPRRASCRWRFSAS